MAKHVITIEPFRRVFENDQWIWNEASLFFRDLHESIEVDFKELPIQNLYQFIEEFNMNYINLTGCLLVYKNHDSEVQKTMKAFTTFYNEVIQHLILLDGEKKVQSHYLYKK
jgi:hypothetical protein